MIVRQQFDFVNDIDYRGLLLALLMMNLNGQIFLVSVPIREAV